jgi:hypothetical protein
MLAFFLDLRHMIIILNVIIVQEILHCMKHKKTKVGAPATKDDLDSWQGVWPFGMVHFRDSVWFPVPYYPIHYVLCLICYYGSHPELIVWRIFSPSWDILQGDLYLFILCLNRLSLLIDHSISLFGNFLPFDSHPTDPHSLIFSLHMDFSFSVGHIIDSSVTSSLLLILGKTSQSPNIKADDLQKNPSSI